MNIDQFEIFKTIAKTKSFTKAAKILNFTQPAISSQIKMLEQRYNVPLFERAYDGVKLTEAGRKFYEYGDRILSIYEDMENDIFKSVVQDIQMLRIGAEEQIGKYFLPSALISYKSGKKEMQIKMDLGNAQEIINSIKENKIDIGLIEGDFRFINKINIIRLDSYDLILAGSPNLVSPTISICKLFNLPFIAREEESMIRYYMKILLKRKGIHTDYLNIIAEVNDFETIKEIVIASKGISLFPYKFIKKELENKQLIEISIQELIFDWVLNIIYSKEEELSNKKQDFIKVISDFDKSWVNCTNQLI